MSDGGIYCDIAASCLCGGAYIHAGNLPADAVLEATITSSYVAQVTAIFGSTPAFTVGDAICIDQSVVGATILVPVQNASDAAQAVLPPPEGGTCVPNYAYTVLLDDGGRPLQCNDGTQSSLSLTTQQTIDALRAKSCTTSLSAFDLHWSQNECASPGGCHASPSPVDALGACVVALGALLLVRRRR